ncbi:MAG: 50S ribosomal protein L11 methyltransferase, partial [Bacteroidetes bacterium]|nr:50S ribosomal protein L11 methyltransferase [Bacteroidota bacterium]
MFQETEKGVKAYIETQLFNQKELDELPFIKENNEVHISYTIAKAENRNWNEEWESNFKPVIIGKEIYVRAEYHMPDPTVKYEVVIQPRMAFGTGHHATTSMMMESMLKIDFRNKKVLDMGCGTAILAILADKMGATSITAIDNDPNAVENSFVNCAVNGVKAVSVLLGDAKTPGKDRYDVVLANINRNIIVEDIAFYDGNILPGGSLLCQDFISMISNLLLKRLFHWG